MKLSKREGAIPFGDPVTGIVAEAESVGADLIAMASHRGRSSVGRLMKRSLARRLQCETTIPLRLVPYGARTAPSGRAGRSGLFVAVGATARQVTLDGSLISKCPSTSAL